MISAKEVQRSKHSYPKDVTEEGIVTLAKEVQPEKQLFPKDVTKYKQ
mgnify:CR=1 FL=1